MLIIFTDYDDYFKLDKIIDIKFDTLSNFRINVLKSQIIL